MIAFPEDDPVAAVLGRSGRTLLKRPCAQFHAENAKASAQIHGMSLGEFLRDFIEEAVDDGLHFLMFITRFFTAILQ